ncbi:MAG: hypothetical protein HYY50_00490 [Candidatus Kerfeldbacteria bacterium]|nr:hypothetical protein [Candidatus Kerfeldbacteria bacterium]
MILTLRIPWMLVDGSTASARPVYVASGRYRVERIPNPVTGQGYWLVLAGTKVGAAEEFLRSLCRPELQDFSAVIEPDPHYPKTWTEDNPPN